MAELYPTKTRLALLCAIGGDEVVECNGEFWMQDPHDPDRKNDRKVTDRTREQIKAGWAEVVDPAPGIGHAPAFRRVRPTHPLGYAVLAEHFPQWRDVPDAAATRTQRDSPEVPS